MLRIVEMAGSEAAKEYYTAALARADYYVSGSEIVGQWCGKGVYLLGLHDAPVDQRTFGLMADNLHPHRPNERLTARTRTDRRVGYDFNFHAPKGLSVMHALTGDERLQSIFIEAVRATMDEMEQYMQVRVRTDGKTDANRTTGNWAYGEFVHLTARPATADGVPDPHLHCHCTVMNASYDATEQRWKAGQFGSLKRDANYFEAAFHARLARAVTELGYRIKRHSKYWELADLPDSVVEKFSKRTVLIDEAAKERGITDAKAKDRLGAETRAVKRRGLTTEELKRAWMSQLSEAEVIALRAAGVRATKPPTHRQIVPARISPRTCIDFALEHLFERKSVASDKQIAEVALRHGVGQGVEVGDVWRELDQRIAGKQIFRRQIEDQQLCTTREAYAETSRCIEYTRDGMGCCRALAADWEISRAELLVPTAADQRGAIQHVLRSTDRVIAIQGRAGAGKTFATQEIAAALGSTGCQIHALAPTSKAVQVLREEGFAIADTVSQLLINPQLQASVAGAVLLIDEAGLLSARQLDQLFGVAKDQNCRVLLQYDLRQHRAVERGSPVRDLERYAGLHPAEIHVVRRQKPEDYRAAVTNLSLGKIDKAFAQFQAMNTFFENADPRERHQRLASDYLDATRKQGAKVLVVSPTHREGDAVTRAIRVALRHAGRIGEDEHETMILQRSGLTAAQRGEPTSYSPGQIVQYTQNTSVHQRGERLVIKERLSDGTVLAQRSAPSGRGAGAAFALCLVDKDSFDVYEPKNIGLSIGDRVRITQNGYVPILGISESDRGREESPAEVNGTAQKNVRGKKKPARHRLINNAMYEIVCLTKSGDFVLNNGWVLPRSYGHFAHGYCTTSHASQGMTVDTVLIAQSTESFGASSHEQFYVSCSRGRNGIKIYTDSVAELSQAVRQSHQQTSAADLVLAPPGPERPSEIQPSGKKSAASVRHQRTLQTAITTVQHGRDHLHIALDRGSAVVISGDRARLKTGAKSDSAVLIPAEPPGKRTFVNHANEWVCGSHVSKITEKICTADNSKKLKPAVVVDAASNASPKKTAFVPMFSSEPESQSHHPSI